MAYIRNLVAFAVILIASTWDDPSRIAAQTAGVSDEKTIAITAPATADMLRVTGSRVNVRREPSINAGVLTTYTRGRLVPVLRTRGAWSEIHMGDSANSTGWIASRLLSTRSPAQAPTTQIRQRSVSVPSSREITAARKDLISLSIAAYQGSCPCPYNRDRAGRRCGGRSAWSRPGGASPICYDSDVTEARLQTYFARQRRATF
ncbi:SH3 domain-containing protein [Pseudooceanicola sp.]|uniref:SH3 domain-containing protein n=1 Tax=Pseudooceanicola sp. TaxID=1914328 RepID=UPI0040596553